MSITSIFALPDHAVAKAAPQRIAADEARLRAIGEALEHSITDLESTLATTLATPAHDAQDRVQRDASAQHWSRRLRSLRAVAHDVCLGRMDPADGTPPVYVGRAAVSDADGTPLLVDWRSPVAEPFFAATRAEPLGLVSRRRFRWSDGRISDYWDEILDPHAAQAPGPGADTHPADGSGAAVADPSTISPDQESALLASLGQALGQARSPQMRDVLTTIAADQDAIIRADARLPMVVDGGPGTGKTVVALHRAAYLQYTDPRLRGGRDGILFIGPHHPYLAYVADVLPNLGEDEVHTCTLADLLPEGAQAGTETDPEIRRLKADARMVEAIEPAVGLYEEPPTRTLRVETDWGSVALTADDWADAFAAVDRSTPHNLARPLIWEELAEIVASLLEDEHPTTEQVERSIRRDEDLVGVVHRAWPLLTAIDLVGDLWEVPAYLRRCAPWLDPEQIGLLQRTEARAWTDMDLPLLDMARHRLGDPHTDARRRRQEAARAAEAEQMDTVVDYLIANDGSELQELSMLRGEDLRNALEDQVAVEVASPDALAGPFAHVVVDEAQELTDAQWGMILRRCPSRRLTIVGDRAQAAAGFTGTWQERLARIGLDRVETATLTINYRTPLEIMERAAPVIREVLPDANVPTSIRSSGIPVRHGAAGELERILVDWLDAHEEGMACVICRPAASAAGAFVDVVQAVSSESGRRVRILSPALAKGLEFDLVVLLEPEEFGEGAAGAVSRYVAMTRATSELVILGGRGDG